MAETDDAKVLYEALENLLGDLYLFGLAEIALEDIQAGSARDAMRVLKRMQQYRDRELQSVAIACCRPAVEPGRSAEQRQ
jgi:hypothetical protein